MRSPDPDRPRRARRGRRRAGDDLCRPRLGASARRRSSPSRRGVACPQPVSGCPGPRRAGRGRRRAGGGGSRHVPASARRAVLQQGGVSDLAVGRDGRGASADTHRSAEGHAAVDRPHVATSPGPRRPLPREAEGVTDADRASRLRFLLDRPNRSPIVCATRAHAPCAAHSELPVGEGMISSERRMREIRMSGSMSGRLETEPR